MTTKGRSQLKKDMTAKWNDTTGNEMGRFDMTLRMAANTRTHDISTFNAHKHKILLLIATVALNKILKKKP